MFSRAGLLALVGTLSLGASQAQAVITLNADQSVPVTQILNSQDKKFIIGDKLFTILSYTAPASILNQTDLTAFISANPLDGIGFDLDGPFSDLVAGDNVGTDLFFRYTVEVLPAEAAQGFRIKDNTLLFDGFATGIGSFAAVDESIITPDGLTVLDQTSVYFNSGPPQTAVFSDKWETFNGGYLKLEIVKDIHFKAEPAGGTARASFIRQAFSQVPAPSTAGLLGVAGLVAARRRR